MWLPQCRTLWRLGHSFGEMPYQSLYLTNLAERFHGLEASHYRAGVVNRGTARPLPNCNNVHKRQADQLRLAAG